MTQTPGSGRNRRSDRNTPQAPITPPQKPRRVQTARAPIGRSAELQARQEAMRSASRPTSNGRGERLPLYSDFDPPVAPQVNRSRAPIRVRKEQRKHTALWLIVALFCLSCTGALLIFAAPQFLGGMSDLAFVNGSIIHRDQAAIDTLAGYRRAMAQETIYNGVYIDGIHVGGMTKEQAVAAVGTVPGNAGSSFDIRIDVDGVVWSVNSDSVPLYRNTDEVVRQAYAVGRSNTATVRGADVTPFKQRLTAVQTVWQNPIGYYTVTTYDHDTVRSMVDAIANQINREPVNASVAQFDQSTKTFTFNADESGVYINADDIYNAVIAKLDGGTYFDTIYVQPQVLLAKVTKAELMNSFGLISSFSTTTTSNKNRNINIDLSAQAINGRTVLPGEEFSFNQATGQRTEAKGYKPAAAIAGGETFDEIGGGVCQTSSTLFNAVARANLEITDRDPHAWPSNYVPKGEDATVNWPNLDFRFRNNTEWPIFIVAKYANKKVTVEIYGMSLGDGVTIDLESEVTYTKKPPSEPKYVQNPELAFGTEKVTVKPRTGYTVETYKVWYRNGKEFMREKLHTSHYKMYQEVIEWN